MLHDVHRSTQVYLARMAMELAHISGRPPSEFGPDLLRLTEHLRVLSGPLPMLYGIAQRRFMSQDCYGPMCGKSVQTGTPFQRCARCKFVQYCSKECQLDDWRDAKVPHKRLCPLLQKLVTVASFPSIYADFEAKFKTTGLDVLADCIPIFHWGVLHGDVDGTDIVRELLKHAKGAQSNDASFPA
ncbi:hypothetical protein EXIGLDRAFT_328574 [Exidia glandulosa HHB12029]|uniref:MYND-type domain-containing protein n=1 Tax=Exidia glandulosa HHB12029 TaxID=1314781 RepID=A0A165LPN3_EXIGL|nr:hypothetical protein EXIGLDRAFT_328574 [Exidia glandulosa HHB12029]